jgi:hypothetical protein
MLKLEAVHIEEVRGIRKLDINFGKKTFAISGPNGSGKSGVIDAIEFGLTEQIGRLAGAGTKSLSTSEHGPHVDKTKSPHAAFVELQVFLPDLGKSGTITRKVCTPKKPKISPDEDDVIAAFEEIADHPEVTLSRREILRFILVEPSKRSQEIQALLKLEDCQRITQQKWRKCRFAGAIGPATTTIDGDPPSPTSVTGRSTAHGALPATRMSNNGTKPTSPPTKHGLPNATCNRTPPRPSPRCTTTECTGTRPASRYASACAELCTNSTWTTLSR